MAEGDTKRSALRGYVYIDKAQPQYASLIARTMKGHVPEAGVAQLFLEFDDTIEVLRAMDVALKAANVHAGFIDMLRSPGKMEVHSMSRGDVEEAGRAIQERYGPEETQLKPSILSTQLVTNVDAELGKLVSEMAGNAPVAPAESVFAIELAPSIFAALVCNEAEKHAQVNVVGVKWSGRTGFVYLSGSEEDVMVAREVVLDRLARVPGRERTRRAES